MLFTEKKLLTSAVEWSSPCWPTELGRLHQHPACQSAPLEEEEEEEDEEEKKKDSSLTYRRLAVPCILPPVSSVEFLEVPEHTPHITTSHSITYSVHAGSSLAYGDNIVI